jgi:hypothetical protein
MLAAHHHDLALDNALAFHDVRGSRGSVALRGLRLAREPGAWSPQERAHSEEGEEPDDHDQDFAWAYRSHGRDRSRTLTPCGRSAARIDELTCCPEPGGLL